MSYDPNFVPSEPCPSPTLWIVLFVIFLLIGIIFVVLFILAMTGVIGNNNSGGTEDVVTLGNPRITANANAISGAWGTLTEDTDRVTLYVSEKSFEYDDKGNVIVDQTTTKSSFATGSDNSVNIEVGNSQARNAMLIASREGTAATRVFGPVKVITQSELNLANNLFSINDLNTCTGAVSDTGTYAVQTPSIMGTNMVTGTNDYGIFRLGSNMNTNTASTNFLVRYTDPEDPNSITEPTEVLCRIPATDQVSRGTWINSMASAATPTICREGTVITTDVDGIMVESCPNTQIPLDHCQWSYNTSPEGAAGQNKWCLATSQSLTMTGAVRTPVCLSHDGTALLVKAVDNADQWINLLTGTVSTDTS